VSHVVKIAYYGEVCSNRDWLSGARFALSFENLYFQTELEALRIEEDTRFCEVWCSLIPATSNVFVPSFLYAHRIDCLLATNIDLYFANFTRNKMLRFKQNIITILYP
jgi:hypothetical protein